jgi:hypothetical protein
MSEYRYYEARVQELGGSRGATVNNQSPVSIVAPRPADYPEEATDNNDQELSRRSKNEETTSFAYCFAALQDDWRPTTAESPIADSRLKSTSPVGKVCFSK